MDQLSLFFKYDKKTTHTFEPLVPGGIDFRTFVLNDAFTTTSHTYVDLLTFALTPGNWYIQAMIEGSFSFGRNGSVGFVLNQNAGSIHKEAETFYDFNEWSDPRFSIHMSARIQTFRDSIHTISTRINRFDRAGGLLFINNVVVNANKLVDQH